MSQTFPVPLALSAQLNGVHCAGLARHVAFVALAVMVMMVTPVMGQTVASSFDELRFKVKAGDTVYVTDDKGGPEQQGRIVDLSPTALAVSIDGVRRDMVESDVRRIRQRLPDAMWNGALIGFLVAAVGSTVVGKALESPAGSCDSGCITQGVLYSGGLGALAGLGIDALVQGRKDIYVRGASRSSRALVVRPSVTSQGKSLHVSVRF
jgi:hypothetical protein